MGQQGPVGHPDSRQLEGRSEVQRKARPTGMVAPGRIHDQDVGADPQARNSRRVNAKSIMGVMMLAAGKGATIGLETSGPDEADAMEAIVALINDYFGEGQ
jgi:phosphotransferase system HPr (HPr) family protein